MFPIHRPRRLRQHPQLRRMVQETMVTASDLIYPLFAVPGESVANEVKSMPGVYQLSVDKIVEEAVLDEFPGEYLREKDIEICGKSRILLGGAAEEIHQQNLRHLYKKVHGEVPRDFNS